MDGAKQNGRVLKCQLAIMTTVRVTLMGRKDSYGRKSIRVCGRLF